MNIKEFYKKINGNYNEIMSRLLTEARIQKYVLKFPEDKSFELLHESMNNRDAETAFRMAHTIKGISLNLGFHALGSSSNELCELLRNTNRITEDAVYAWQSLKEDYYTTICAIEQLDDKVNC